MPPERGMLKRKQQAAAPPHKLLKPRHPVGAGLRSTFFLFSTAANVKRNRTAVLGVFSMRFPYPATRTGATLLATEVELTMAL